MTGANGGQRAPACSKCRHPHVEHTGPGGECRHDHEAFAAKAKEQCVCRTYSPGALR